VAKAPGLCHGRGYDARPHFQRVVTNRSPLPTGCSFQWEDVDHAPTPLGRSRRTSN